MSVLENPSQKKKRLGRNVFSVYAAAIVKLALNAGLLALFADKLTEWKVWEDATGLTRPQAALLFALLYLLMLATLPIRNRIGYLYFALLFPFDALFLMQPTKTLLLFAFCTVLLLVLRLKTPLRYVLAALLLAAFSLWQNPYLLIILPLFSLALLWRRSEKWGFRLFLFYLLVLCVAYQFEALDFLPHARGTSGGATFLNNLFEDEELYGHISYFLANSLAILARILFPIEVLFKSARHAWVFLPIQLGALFLYGKTIRYLIDVDWKNPVRSGDRMLHDVLNFVLCFVAAQSIYEPDLGQVFRHMMGLTPCFLYLLFEANRRHERPFVQRDFTGSCPVIFFHRGGEDYVYDVLRQACKVCGGQNVILLGDEANRGFTSNWYAADDYLGERAKKFQEVYSHISENLTEEFERTCFDRHFALYEFCAQKGISRCFFGDSDILLYHDPTQDDYSAVDFACCTAQLPVSLGEASSPHFTYWRLTYLSQFLDFITQVYTSQKAWLEEVSKQPSASGEYQNGDITDTVLLTAWKRILTEQGGTLAFRNHNAVNDGRVCDHNLTSADNAKVGQFRYSSLLGIKKIRFRNHIPMLTQTDGTPVAATLLHVQTARDYYTYPLAHESGCKLWYLLNRIGHKLMG